ncbi:FadR/GntR family transcriptional regulator [Martelella endophytica]|uniref:FadR/GntR family transcriptional regulator n=1 Tax=Martelella endophytica TaxID=1486262 RepID=UPI0005F0CD43|nr:FadR/GntR family transcriptional regulator [Martelella endophytica]
MAARSGRETSAGARLSEKSGSAGRKVMAGCLSEFINAIVSGEMPEGALLPSEAELMERFGVSRTTLRETMQYMVAQGLIRSRPRAGTVVLPRAAWNMLDPLLLDAALDHEQDFAFYEALLEAREVLEPVSARRAAMNADNAALIAVTEAFEAMVEASGRDTESWSQADLDFHTAIIAASGNWVFMQFGVAIRGALLASFRMTNRASHAFDDALELHRRILEAIRLRQPDVAESAMRELIARAREDMEHVRPAAARKESRDR